MADPARDAARSPAERLVSRDIEEQLGNPLSSRALGFERSVDSYLRAGVRPRWMERLMDIERGIRTARRELAKAYAQLQELYGDDPGAFARRWREVAARWDFSEHNALVRSHNQWYPIERDLPVNPRTGEFVLVMGRPYQREELDAAWVLAEFPAQIS